MSFTFLKWDLPILSILPFYNGIYGPACDEDIGEYWVTRTRFENMPRPKALSSGQEKEILRRVSLGETHDSLAVHYGVDRSLISKMVKKYRGSTDFQINVAPKLTPNAPSVEQESAFPNMELNSEYCGLPCSAPSLPFNVVHYQNPYHGPYAPQVFSNGMQQRTIYAQGGEFRNFRNSEITFADQTIWAVPSHYNFQPANGGWGQPAGNPAVPFAAAPSFQGWNALGAGGGVRVTHPAATSKETGPQQRLITLSTLVSEASQAAPDKHTMSDMASVTLSDAMPPPSQAAPNASSEDRHRLHQRDFSKAYSARVVSTSAD